MNYRITFAEVDTGIVLLDSGDRALNGAQDPARFETLDDAREFASSKLNSIPYGEAWIGDDNDPQLELILSPDYPTYEREKRAFEFWYSLPFWRRWFTPRPHATVYLHPDKLSTEQDGGGQPATRPESK